MACKGPCDMVDDRCTKCRRYDSLAALGMFEDDEVEERVDATTQTTERDKWIRLFNRLDAAISHHHGADAFKDSHDEALYKARAKILADAMQTDAMGRKEQP